MNITISRYWIYSVLMGEYKLLIYLPFFLCTFCCFVLCATVTVAPECGCKNGGLKPSFVNTLKIFAFNVAIAFVLFVIVGSIFKVIVVTLY